MANTPNLTQQDFYYKDLFSIRIFLECLIGTKQFVSTSNSQNENWARYILNRIKDNVDPSDLTEEEFVSLLNFFGENINNSRDTQLSYYRTEFIEFLLEKRGKISFDTATELYEIVKKWSLDKATKILQKHINWKESDPEQIIAWGKKFDSAQTWKWIAEKNNSKEVLDRKTLVELAEEANDFPKEILLSWAKETVTA